MSSTRAVPHDRGVVVAERPRLRRVLEGVGFVAAWVGLGYLLPFSAEAYLLMGIPLTVAFSCSYAGDRWGSCWSVTAERARCDHHGSAVGTWR